MHVTVLRIFQIFLRFSENPGKLHQNVGNCEKSGKLPEKHNFPRFGGHFWAKL
jgi:hypothetical protein